MKKIILSFIFFYVCLFSVQAQTLYGSTGYGGAHGGGTINKFIPGKNNLTVVKSFEGLGLNPMYTSLIQASDGKLYGMTNSSIGTKSTETPFSDRGIVGIIFSFDPSTSSYTILKFFGDTDGSRPYGSVIQASNGKLYGMASQGGSMNGGVIFSFDIFSATYTKLYDFDFTNGAAPWGSLIQANDGKLYGMTKGGGSNDRGVIFSFDISSSTFTKLMDFDGINGSDPKGSLMQASNGKLYGMTGGGGNGSGVLFSFDIFSSTYAKLRDFNQVTDGAPDAGQSLMQASDGKLYGMTSGVIFSFDILAGIYTTMKNFDQVDDGTLLSGNLMQANDGKLYGMTEQGGSSGNGVIFSFVPSTSAYFKVKDFDYTYGGYPRGSLMQASDGKLYGLTSGGGSSYYFNGVIFSYDILTGVYAKLMDFDANNDGTNPTGSLFKASDGKLYGTTGLGGKFGRGVIFSFDTSTSAYTKLKDFDYVNGGNPNGSLMQASNGKLYGMTKDGGRFWSGVIFSYDPLSSIYKKLYDFPQINNAVNTGSLIQASDGILYGTTTGGGSNGAGIIFSFDPSSSTFKTLVDFSHYNGGSCGSLMQSGDGKLYGLTSGAEDNGYSSYGTIFSFDPSSSTYTKLYEFVNNNTGITPLGNLIELGNGKLYGMTSSSSSYGVIFSFDPSSSTYTKLHDFDDFNNGTYPNGSLVQASDGKLYGTTGYGGRDFQGIQYGGFYGLGVVFSFDPLTAAYAKLIDFDGSNGANPLLGSAFIEVNNNPLPAVTLPSDYFRTITSGNWNTPATWESSPVADFSSGVISPATLAPDFNANTITIRGPHSINVTANVVAAQTTVTTGGNLTVISGVIFTVK